MVRTSGTTKKSNTRGDQELNGTSVVTNDGADLSRPMVLHGAALQPSHERSESNDNCSEDLTPAKAMKLSTEEVKAYDDFAAIEKRVFDDRQAPQVVRSVQGVIRNCLQKLWIASVAHWQTNSRLLPLSFLGVA